jgi:precorrin-6A/cobalt-precorrin-6A reductase
VILVLGGTRDGREISAGLSEAGYEVITSVISDYGRELLEQGGLKAQSEAMSEKELEVFMRRLAVRVLVDATHPYAVNVSNNASRAAAKAGVPYIRYERPCSDLPDYPGLRLAQDMQDAARLSVSLGKTVFLTTGSHTLPIFRAAAMGTDIRLIARVLPQPDVVAACLAAGFRPADIVAAQGPFSQELNRALFREFRTDVVVTKNSGEVGGTGEKIAAAVELGLALVVVQRPPLVKEQVFASVTALIEYMKNSEVCR